MTSSSLSDFRYRQIHLDFHTSEHIAAIGADFDPEQFVATLKSGEVDSVTLFARCHHGWCYYPTEVGKAHPNLTRPDLLGEMIAACHAADIATPVYLTVQWDEVMARENPQWRIMQAHNKAANYPGTEPSTGNQLTPTWHSLCLNHKGYVDYLIELSLEVAQRYKPPGFFMDIIGNRDCVCNECLKSMQAAGLDALSAADRQINDEAVNSRFFNRFKSEIAAQYPDLRVFFNSGHIYKGERERYKNYDHLELESLPTGGWGYDHFPTSARYADTLGHDYLGMTGRFHTHWGEFGGYKSAQALEFECTQMMALGARCSIGDQLHPNGKMNQATYDLIRPAFARVKALEPFVKGARYLREIAILSDEAVNADLRTEASRNSVNDAAAARMLLEMQMPFDVIDTLSDFNDYRLLILPDKVRLSAQLAQRIADFQAQGGAVIASGLSGMDRDEDRFVLDIGATYAGELDFDPSYLQLNCPLDSALVDAPIVMYARGQQLVVTDAQVQAEVIAPYFNRSFDKFCSHLHSPEDTSAEPLGAAMLKKGRCSYIAFPVFELYASTGQPLYKYLVRGMIKQLLDKPLITTNLTSSGRVSLTEQADLQRKILHLMYAPTQLRGSGIMYNDGEMRALEIIEDVPVLHNVSAQIKCTEAITAVTDAYTGEAVSWSQQGEVVSLQTDKLHIHAALVIDYA